MSPSHAMAESCSADWDHFEVRWARLTAPLRPHDDVCQAVRRLIADCPGANLLLGVTPEFSRLASWTVAADWSGRMIGTVWPGNDPSRAVVRSDWRRLPLSDRTFTTVIGDGSLSCLEFPNDYRLLFDELARVLRPGGRLVLRVFLRPDTSESLASVGEQVHANEVGSIHALKWRLAHALCAARETANIGINEIHRAFQSQFPNRALLGRTTGWSHDEIGAIDLFAGRPDAFSFPTARELLAVVPGQFSHSRLLHAGSYELAERCPLLVAERT